MSRLAAALVGLAFAFAGAPPADAEPPVIPLPADARVALEPLGDVIDEALPARPIDDPARLRHLAPGTLTYRIVAGANRGQVQTVRVEPVADDGEGSAWRLVTDNDEIQQLRVTTHHEVIKLSQTDKQSDRIIQYRPALVLEPGMRPGESKTASAELVTRKASDPNEVEYKGHLDYTTRYIGAYRLTTPAGSFDTRLLEHRYTMKIGPAKARYESFGFYADDLGNVAEVADESVSALLLYRRSSSSARLLLSASPE